MAKAKKPAPAKQSAPPKPPAASVIDPAQAAAAAASMVAHKVPLTSTDDVPHAETAAFRNLKQSMNKSVSQTLGSMLDKHVPAGQKRSNLPFGNPKQVGHNQTFGADVSRRNVPRRTGG